MHFVFVVSSNKPSPAGRGNEGGWLRHYKIEREDEVFIPWEEEPGVPKPWKGDHLWMQIDADVIGVVQIARVEEDQINGRFELWFDGGNIQPVKGVKSELSTGRVAELTAESWLKQLATQ